MRARTGRCRLPHAWGVCARSRCRFRTCAPGFATCDGRPATGSETDVRSDVANCGGCGVVCTGPARTTVVCRSGRCGFVLEVADGGGDGFTTLVAGTMTAEVLGAAGGRGGRGGAAFIGTGSGGAGGSAGAGGKVTATFRVEADENFLLLSGRAGEDGGNAVGGNAGAGGDTSGGDGDDGTNGTSGSGGGGGGGSGGAGLGGSGVTTAGGAGGAGASSSAAGEDLGGAGGRGGVGGAPGSGSGEPGGDGQPGNGRGGAVEVGANPGPGRVRVTFTAG